MAKEQLDPVCEMMVDPDQSVYKSSQQNEQYVFCSKHCLESFENDSEKYMYRQSQQQNQANESTTEYRCLMHLQIVQNHQRNCPICRIMLEPRSPGAESGNSEYRDMSRRFWIGLILSIPILTLAIGGMLLSLEQFITARLYRLIHFFYVHLLSYRPASLFLKKPIVLSFMVISICLP